MRAQPICGAYQLMGCTAREPYKKSASSLPRSIVLLIIRIFCFLCNTHSLTADSSSFFLSSTSWHLGSVLLFKPKKKSQPGCQRLFVYLPRSFHGASMILLSCYMQTYLRFYYRFGIIIVPCMPIGPDWRAHQSG